MVAQIVEIIDVQTFLGQQILNVYHYLDAAGDTDPALIAGGFVGGNIPDIIEMQNDSLSHVAIRYRSVYPTATLQYELEITPPIAGTVETSADLPSSYAASFKMLLGPTIVLTGGFTGHLKRSGKRIGGIDHEWAFGNLYSPTFLGLAEDYQTGILTVAATSSTLVVASFLDGARVRQPIVQAYAPITGVSIPGPSTQRSRSDLRGLPR